MTSPTTLAHFTCGRSGRSPCPHIAVEDAAVHRLEAVAHVGQRPRDDDRHGVLEEGALHLQLGSRSARSTPRSGRSLAVGRCSVVGCQSWSLPFRQSWNRRSARVGRTSDVEEADVFGVGLDEVPPTLDVVAHEHRAHLVRDAAPAPSSPAGAPAWPGSIVVSRSSSKSISPRPFRRWNSFVVVRVLLRGTAACAASSFR